MNILGPARSQASLRVAIALVLAVGVVAALGPAGVPSAQGVSVSSPTPQPESVVEVGAVTISADVIGSDEGRLEVNGVPLDGDVESGISTTLERGGHVLAVRVGGDVVREWTVYAADIDARQVDEDPLAVGLAASGTVTRNRPVVLVNPRRPELALAGPDGRPVGGRGDAARRGGR